MCRRVLLLSASMAAVLVLSACGEEKKTGAQPSPKEDLSKSDSVFNNPFPPAPVIEPAAVVATVDGKEIKGSELERQLQALQGQLMRRVTPEQLGQMMPRLQQQAVANLVNEKLLLAAAAKKNITISDAELGKAKEDVMKGAPPGQTLESALAQANLTMDEFTAQMRDGLTIRKLMEDVVSKAEVSDADVKDFYDKNPDHFKKPETVSARHILIKVDDTTDEAKKAEARKKAETVRERLVKGEDFATVCAETSDDPGSKDNGGLYENFPRGQMVPPFEEAAFTQKAGEVGPLVETQFGFHIIKVEKHNEAGMADLTEVKDRVKGFLENRKKQEAAQAYLKELNDAAKITYGKGFEPPAPPSAPEAAPKAANEVTSEPVAAPPTETK